MQKRLLKSMPYVPLLKIRRELQQQNEANENEENMIAVGHEEHNEANADDSEFTQEIEQRNSDVAGLENTDDHNEATGRENNAEKNTVQKDLTHKCRARLKSKDRFTKFILHRKRYRKAQKIIRTQPGSEEFSFDHNGILYGNDELSESDVEGDVEGDCHDGIPLVQRNRQK